MTRLDRIYLALWRKAVQNSGLVIRLPDKALALSMRLGLYRAIRPYRSGKLYDEELYQALSTLVIKVVENNKKITIEFIERPVLYLLEDQLTDLGIEENDLLLPEEKEQYEQLKRLEKLTWKSPNPFYGEDE